MATITVTIPPALKRKLDKLSGDGWVKEPLDELLDFILEQAREYPPESSATYNRTFDLRESWRKEGNAVVSEGPVYNRYVMGELDQAWMHKGHWQTDQDIAEIAADESLVIFNRFVEMIVNE